MGGTPGESPVPINLRGSKYFIKYSLLANFHKGTGDLAYFITIFVKFLTPLTWGVSLKMVRSGSYSNLICLLSLEVSVPILVQIAQVLRYEKCLQKNRQTDRRTWLNRLLYRCWLCLYIRVGQFLAVSKNVFYVQF